MKQENPDERTSYGIGTADSNKAPKRLRPMRRGCRGAVADPRAPRGQVGVIIHHVASVYPLEIHLAMEIASGKRIDGVTWGVVADMNAKHAHEHAAVAKQDTIGLLRSNSHAAAETVRGLSDEQLDRAAPVSLNANAPLTAQFLIEDHALKHSWHHLAKIKAVL